LLRYGSIAILEFLSKNLLDGLCYMITEKQLLSR
jgi:hypothetical protein